jgi:hypothetical protein
VNKKPKLKWEKSGRSFGAVAGRLTLMVRREPRTIYGAGRWFVREVFGHSFLDSETYPSLDAAAIAAEAAGRKALTAAKKALGR